jgi:outer membrane protein W
MFYTDRKTIIGVAALLLTHLFFPNAWAGGHQYQVGGGLQYFAGLPDKSFASNTATVARFGARFGERSVFSWVANTTLMSSSGAATFKVDGTATANPYQLMGAEFMGGFRFLPLANSSRLPVQPFFGAQGVFQINSVKFPNASSTTTTFPKTDTQYFTGYAFTVGTDLYFNKNWGFSIQVDQVLASGTLANSTFSSNATRFMLLLFVE